MNFKVNTKQRGVGNWVVERPGYVYAFETFIVYPLAFIGAIFTIMNLMEAL